MRLNRYILSLLCMMLSWSVTSSKAAETQSVVAVEAAFVYNFFKFVEWPVMASQEGYKLCTTNTDALSSALSAIDGKFANGRVIRVSHNVKVNALGSCDMVFVSEGYDKKQINKLINQPILMVSDAPDFIENDGMIGLVVEGDRVGFEVNLNATKRANLHLSAQMLKLAKKVLGKQ